MPTRKTERPLTAEADDRELPGLLPKPLRYRGPRRLGRARQSKQRLRTKPKHCFADPSLPASLPGVDESALVGNTQLFGQLFGELCLRDLRVYAQSIPGAGPNPLYYYRDADGLEADAVIKLRDGRWCAIGIKLGVNKVDEALASLRRLRNKISLNPAARNPEPSFMLVLVGKTDFAYRTDDGIYVVPITELGH